MAEILFLVHRAPWPPDRGDRIRSWHMFEALAKLAPVHVAALADNEADAALARDKMAPLCKSLAIEVRKASRPLALARRSEEHTSELQSLMRISYAVFCLNTKKYRSI